MRRHVAKQLKGPRSSRELVLTALRERGAMSRAELARYAQVAPSTISAVVQDLVAGGVVVGSGGPRATQRPRTGRPGLRLTLNPGYGAVAGVEFGFRRLRVLLCDLAHDIIGSGECDLPDGHASAEGLAVARRLLDETLAAAGLGHGALIGAGVSLPGPIRHDPGAPDAVKPSGVLPGWHGVTGPDVERALGVPVSIDNDANLAALGEHLWGAGRGCDDCVTVKFHYGIGCGLFVNGALVRGAAGGAGELGHTTVDERGPLCRCGKRGCLDSYAAIPAILDALRPQHGPLTLAGLMALIARRDPGAVRVVSDAAGLVGRQLAIACNLLAPRRVVVAGAMAEAGEIVLGPLRAALRRDIAPNEPPELVLGALGPRHTALGAIALALDQSDWLPSAARPSA
ncbi:MAG TPA: ROK family protein [Streptosporangiaceae bacterium]|nr:ROK family protein [Streptosporangiaceae bacterium]